MIDVLQIAMWHAPNGGLQQHVLSLMDSVRNAGLSVAIACRETPFTSLFRERGHRVIATEFGDEDVDRVASEARGCKLIHAHPGRSRPFALKVAHKLSAPLVVTIHGDYVDAIDTYHKEVSRIFAVSASVVSNLVGLGVAPDKIVYAPNYSNRNLFHPTARRHAKSGSPCSKIRTLVGASRLNADKKPYVHHIAELADKLAARPTLGWRLVIAGDGDLRPILEAAFERLRRAHGQHAALLLGWVPQTKVAKWYRRADAAIVAGRSAIDALACDLPVIVIGREKLFGFVTPELLAEAVDSNMADHWFSKAEPEGGIMSEFDACEAFLEAHAETYSLDAYRRNFQPYECDAAVIATYRTLLAAVVG